MSKFHFAIQAKAGDDRSSVAKVFFEKAQASKVAFMSLESLDDFTVGTHRFMRFRVDANPLPILEELFVEGRGVISLTDAYRVRLPGGRTAVVPHATMQAVARAPYAFRGTKQKHWERQFGSA